MTATLTSTSDLSEDRHRRRDDQRRFEQATHRRHLQPSARRPGHPRDLHQACVVPADILSALLTLARADLQALRALTDRFVWTISQSTPKMPFGMRYIAREIFRALSIRFADEPEEALARVVLQIVYYRFIQPAVVYVALHSRRFLALTLSPTGLPRRSMSSTRSSHHPREGTSPRSRRCSTRSPFLASSQTKSRT